MSKKKEEVRTQSSLSEYWEFVDNELKEKKEKNKPKK